MKEAMKILFEILNDLNKEQKAKMEELKATMIGVANSWLEDYKKSAEPTASQRTPKKRFTQKDTQASTTSW